MEPSGSPKHNRGAVPMGGWGALRYSGPINQAITMKLPSILAAHPVISAIVALVLAYALFSVARALVVAVVSDIAASRARRLRAARLAAATSDVENPYFMTKS